MHRAAKYQSSGGKWKWNLGQLLLLLLLFCFIFVAVLRTILNELGHGRSRDWTWGWGMLKLAPACRDFVTCTIAYSHEPCFWSGLPRWPHLLNLTWEWLLFLKKTWVLGGHWNCHAARVLGLGNPFSQTWPAGQSFSLQAGDVDFCWEVLWLKDECHFLTRLVLCCFASY